MKKILIFALEIIYLPLSIYGMVVCCLFCTWLIYVPVLIVGIFLALTDFALMGRMMAEIDEETKLSTKELEEFIQTGGERY